MSGAAETDMGSIPKGSILNGVHFQWVPFSMGCVFSMVHSAYDFLEDLCKPGFLHAFSLSLFLLKTRAANSLGFTWQIERRPCDDVVTAASRVTGSEKFLSLTSFVRSFAVGVAVRRRQRIGCVPFREGDLDWKYYSERLQDVARDMERK